MGDTADNISVLLAHNDLYQLFSGEQSGRFGGAEVQLFDLAEELATLPGVSCYYLTDQEADYIAHDEITIISVPNPLSSNLETALQDITTNTSRVLLQTIACPAMIELTFSALDFGIAPVYRVSCDADIDGSLFFDEQVHERYIQALKASAGIIVQTPEQAEKIQALHALDSYVIEKGLRIPAQLEQPNQRSGILWVGRCVALKQPWLFIELARALPGQDFHMIMTRDDIDLEDAIRADAEQTPNLEVVFNVPYSDTWQYFLQSEALVGTSLIEGGLPVVYLQAMAMGTPVFSLHVTTENAQKAHALYYAGGSMSDLQRMLADCFSCKPHTEKYSLHELGERGRSYFTTHHGIHESAMRYAQILRLLAKKAGNIDVC